MVIFNNSLRFLLMTSFLSTTVFFSCVSRSIHSVPNFYRPLKVQRKKTFASSQKSRSSIQKNRTVLKNVPQKSKYKTRKNNHLASYPRKALLKNAIFLTKKEQSLYGVSVKADRVKAAPSLKKKSTLSQPVKRPLVKKRNSLPSIYVAGLNKRVNAFTNQLGTPIPLSSQNTNKLYEEKGALSSPYKPETRGQEISPSLQAQQVQHQRRNDLERPHSSANDQSQMPAVPQNTENKRNLPTGAFPVPYNNQPVQQEQRPTVTPPFNPVPTDGKASSAAVRPLPQNNPVNVQLPLRERGTPNNDRSPFRVLERPKQNAVEEKPTRAVTQKDNQTTQHPLSSSRNVENPASQQAQTAVLRKKSQPSDEKGSAPLNNPRSPFSVLERPSPNAVEEKPTRAVAQESNQTTQFPLSSSRNVENPASQQAQTAVLREQSQPSEEKGSATLNNPRSPFSVLERPRPNAAEEKPTRAVAQESNQTTQFPLSSVRNVENPVAQQAQTAVLREQSQPSEEKGSATTLNNPHSRFRFLERPKQSTVQQRPSGWEPTREGAQTVDKHPLQLLLSSPRRVESPASAYIPALQPNVENHASSPFSVPQRAPLTSPLLGNREFTENSVFTRSIPVDYHMVTTNPMSESFSPQGIPQALLVGSLVNRPTPLPHSRALTVRQNIPVVEPIRTKATAFPLLSGDQLKKLLPIFRQVNPLVKGAFCASHYIYPKTAGSTNVGFASLTQPFLEQQPSKPGQKMLGFTVSTNNLDDPFFTEKKDDLVIENGVTVSVDAEGLVTFTHEANALLPTVPGFLKALDEIDDHIITQWAALLTTLPSKDKATARLQLEDAASECPQQTSSKLARLLNSLPEDLPAVVQEDSDDGYATGNDPDSYDEESLEEPVPHNQQKNSDDDKEKLEKADNQPHNSSFYSCAQQ